MIKIRACWAVELYWRPFGKDDRVEAVALQTVSEKNCDGFLIAVIK